MGKYKPYIVIAPAYDTTSGGIRVIHALRSWLEIKGQVVFMNAKIEDHNSIAIYPEIYHGNPAEANRVVRYILNTPGRMANFGQPGPTVFDKNDLLFYFSRIYAPKTVKSEQIMFLPILNLHIFKNYGRKKRKERCVYVGWGDETKEFTKSLFHITREFALDQQRLADYLNTCEVMYSYDQVSAMFEIARLCGCRVEIISDGRFKKQDIAMYEPGLNGITFGLNNKTEQLDSKAFRDHYMSLIKLFDRKIDNFISLTQHE